MIFIFPIPTGSDLSAASASSSTREASDGTYRHRTPPRHRPAALRRRVLGLCPGLIERASRGGSYATGRRWWRRPAGEGHRDDVARRAGAEQRGGARVQASEPRRTGPPASLGDDDHRGDAALEGSADASCRRRSARGPIGVVVFLFVCMFQ